MSRTTDANYDAKDTSQKKPVVIAEFNGITRKYSSETFSNISADHRKYLRFLRANLGHITPLESRSEIEEMEVEILDKDLDVTDKLKDNDFEGRDITVKLGFQGIDDTSFVSLPTQKIRDIQLSPTALAWSFISRNVKFNLKDKIFRSLPQTNLTQAHTDVVATITVVDTSTFIDPTELPSALSAFLIINSEVIKYPTIATGTTFDGGITRGAAGTTAKAHQDGDLVTQFICFEGVDPFTALLFLLMTTDDGSGHVYYDINQHLTAPQVAGIGLGLTATDVDLEQIEQLGYKYFEVIEYAANIGAWQEQQAATWIEDNILKYCSAYLYLSDSKLSVQIFDYIELRENYSAADTFDKDDILLEPAPSYRLELENLINVIEIRYDKNAATGQFKKSVRYKFDDSVTAYGQNDIPFVVEHPNILTNINTDYIADAVLRRWFYLWGNQTAIYNIHTPFSKWLLEPNDDLTNSYDFFPDLVDGTMGWNAKKSKLLSQNIELLDGRAIFNFTGFTWEALTRVASLYTKDVGTDDDNWNGGGGQGKEAVTFNADNSATLNAEDGFWNPNITANYQVYVFFVDIVEPAVVGPTQDWHTIGIGLKAQTAGPVNAISDNRAYIRYDPAGSATHNLAFFITANSAFTALTLKVDWYQDSTGATPAERPSSVTFSEAWRITLDKAISEL